MLTVHHLNNSRSQRILWLLEELAIPYDVKRYERDSTTMLAPPELRAIHPLGKSPVITDGTHTIAETGAIVDYIIDTYAEGRLIPPANSEDRLRYTYWLHFAEGSAMPPLVMTLVFNAVATRAPFFIRPIAKGISENVQKNFLRPNIDAQLAFMEHELTKTPWFAGPDFTAADVMMSFPVEAAKSRGGLGAHAKLTGWLTQIHARPAYQAALARGGAYAYA